MDEKFFKGVCDNVSKGLILVVLFIIENMRWYLMLRFR